MLSSFYAYIVDTVLRSSFRSLLIAMMNNTYNLISADALKYWCVTGIYACASRVTFFPDGSITRALERPH